MRFLLGIFCRNLTNGGEVSLQIRGTSKDFSYSIKVWNNRWIEFLLECSSTMSNVSMVNGIAAHSLLVFLVITILYSYYLQVCSLSSFCCSLVDNNGRFYLACWTSRVEQWRIMSIIKDDAH
jgi:hypothetical protein